MRERKYSTLRKLSLAFFLPIIIIVSACGSQLTSGTVIGKQDIPAHVETLWQAVYRQSCGYSYVFGHWRYSCSQQYAYSLPYPDPVPETWQLHISSDGKTQWVSVSQSVYNSQPIGSHWQQVQGN